MSIQKHTCKQSEYNNNDTINQSLMSGTKLMHINLESLQEHEPNTVTWVTVTRVTVTRVTVTWLTVTWLFVKWLTVTS